VRDRKQQTPVTSLQYRSCGFAVPAGLFVSGCDRAPFCLRSAKVIEAGTLCSDPISLNTTPSSPRPGEFPMDCLRFSQMKSLPGPNLLTPKCTNFSNSLRFFGRAWLWQVSTTTGEKLRGGFFVDLGSSSVNMRGERKLETKLPLGPLSIRSPKKELADFSGEHVSSDGA